MENIHYKKDGVVTMFETKFKVVEIRNGGVTMTHYLKGTKKDVKKDIVTFKRNCKKYEMFGKEGMIVWM
jgi:hypothetical protein